MYFKNEKKKNLHSGNRFLENWSNMSQKETVVPHSTREVKCCNAHSCIHLTCTLQKCTVYERLDNAHPIPYASAHRHRGLLGFIWAGAKKAAIQLEREVAGRREPFTCTCACTTTLPLNASLLGCERTKPGTQWP